MPFFEDFGLHEDFCLDVASDFRVAIETMKKFVCDRTTPSDIDRYTRLRYPVALFFIRGGRGGEGKVLAEECKASLNYWALDSGNYIDILLPGWGRKEGSAEFDTRMF